MVYTVCLPEFQLKKKKCKIHLMLLKLKIDSSNSSGWHSPLGKYELNELILFQISSRINLLLVFINILVILCFVCVGYFHVEHENWTDPPGFFAHGFPGVGIFILIFSQRQHIILSFNLRVTWRKVLNACDSFERSP